MHFEVAAASLALLVSPKITELCDLVYQLALFTSAFLVCLCCFSSFTADLAKAQSNANDQSENRCTVFAFHINHFLSVLYSFSGHSPFIRSICLVWVNGLPFIMMIISHFAGAGRWLPSITSPHCAMVALLFSHFFLDHCPIWSCVVLCVCFLTASSIHLNSKFFYRQIYFNQSCRF